MCKAFIERGHAFMIGEGKNIWTRVHVHDLSQLFLNLVEAAGNLSPLSSYNHEDADITAAAGGGKATWNDEGYYFAEAGEFVWGDMCRKIAEEVKKQGYIERDGLVMYTIEEGDEVTPNGGK